MKKQLLALIAGTLTLVSCSSMPDGISADAFAPYCPAPRTLLCNTGRGLGTAAFSNANNCLYYEFENQDDKEAAGFYQRVSETQAHVIIRSDDTYETEYVLTFESPEGGKVEELYTQNNYTEKYPGTFTLR